MAKTRGLPEDVKVFMVRRFAAFDEPKAVATAVKDEFGIELSRQAAEHYDPKTKAGANLSKRLRAEFERARKAYLEDLDDIPEAHKAVRVRHLADAARRAKEKGNTVLMATLLEQIAKESGNAFTNRREFTGKNGGPIEFADLSDDQINARLAALAGAAADGDGSSEG